MTGLVLFILVSVLAALAALALTVVVLVKSFHFIDEDEIGLVSKNLAFKQLEGDNPIAFNGEAGYQSDLLMPGLRFMFWPVFSVEKYPWVQVSAGQIGVVQAQIGEPLPIGAKSAIYKEIFGDYRDLSAFIKNGGQKGIQRPVLSPGTIVPIHPVAFLVVTSDKVFGLPMSDDVKREIKGTNRFGLDPSCFQLTVIEPESSSQGVRDIIGIVTTLEGPPLPAGDIASRMNGFQDIGELEESNDEISNASMIELLLGSQNDKHNNYQDYQKFLTEGGTMGLQHDPLMYGAYALNPFLVRVEKAPMLVVQQGQVAVVKAYVGLATEDVSGDDFKFGSLVRPGHRGIWQEPLRTGKYALNPRCYQVEKVPTCILTLNWANAVSKAHDLDQQLSSIGAKSKEGFIFTIDLQVQIHVPDTKAPQVISMVGTMANLVNEVLQAAVGNHFRDKLQTMAAVKFIEDRQTIQVQANDHIATHLNQYDVETRGVYIQDVVLPVQLVEVLTQREIANQEIETYQKQTEAQDQRVKMEKSNAEADKQKDLVDSQLGMEIAENEAKARKNEADGEATFIEKTGAAKAAEVRATALGLAEGYQKQVEAIGQNGTTIVNAVRSLSENGMNIMPKILVNGGGNGGALEGLFATLTGLADDMNSDDDDTAAPKASKADEDTSKARLMDAPSV